MLFIFDWDGTISDSAEKIIGCMQAAAREVQLPVLPSHTIKNIIGLGLPEAIHSLYPDISDDQAEALREHYAAHFIKNDVKPSPFFPGVQHTLEKLLECGHTLTVATGKSRKGLQRVWKNLDMEAFFHGSRCADETASKPNPLMLTELLEEFSVDVQEAVMVGDTEYDMAMAQAIDIPRIAVSYGAHHIDRLRVYDPILCCDSFDEILNYYHG